MGGKGLVEISFNPIEIIQFKQIIRFLLIGGFYKFSRGHTASLNQLEIIVGQLFDPHAVLVFYSGGNITEFNHTLYISACL